VEEHLALPVEEDLDRPPAKAAAGLPQVHLGRLPTAEKLREQVRQLHFAESVVVDGDGELEIQALRLLLCVPRITSGRRTLYWATPDEKGLWGRVARRGQNSCAPQIPLGDMRGDALTRLMLRRLTWEFS
jgi:hypothetical protein